MPRRSSLSLGDITDMDTLSWAFWRASRGLGDRPEVAAMAEDLGAELGRLGEDIRCGKAPSHRWAQFTIHDPKRRLILAPTFRDRVLHHAMMAHMGPILEGALTFDTYACREGKGTLAAVHRAQQHIRRFPWFVKVDMRSYFASIDHSILMGVIERHFKHPELLRLCRRVLERAPTPSGVGLPIGALTSQHFANIYLDSIDRFILEELGALGMVRYMDDVIWWCGSLHEARRTLEAVRHEAWRARRLRVKDTFQIGESEKGVPFLGFRVLPGTLRLLKRRRQRYTKARRRGEGLYLEGALSSIGLQVAADGALGITAHADAIGWRREAHRRCPPVDV